MSPLPDDLPQRREATDLSLDAERAASDDVIEKAGAAIQSLADDVLEADRQDADAAIARVRVRADVIIEESGRGDVRTTTVGLVREARAHERQLTDAVIDQERQRTDDAGAQAGELRAAEATVLERRESTDEKLGHERGTVDAAVTLLGAQEAALSATRAELDRRRAILAMVAHDLRSPLSVIALTTELMAAGSTTDLMRARAAEVSSAALHMKRLVDDLLDFASVEASTFRVTRRDDDLATLLDGMRAAQTLLFEARELTLSFELSERPLRASFDRDRIVQAVSNLLGNALKFTPPGGTVVLTATRRPDGVEVSVRDTGPGLSADAAARVFDRFFQADEVGRQGLGLGLYITKSIVEAHGGRITADPTADTGAVFRFNLPREAS